MMRSPWLIAILLVASPSRTVQAAAISPASQPVAALPPLDLGQTNILDAEAGPGRLLEIVSFGSGAWRLADANGRDVPGGAAQQVVTILVHPVLILDAKVLGAHPGVEALFPFGYVNNSFPAAGAGHDSGLGDITLAPFLEWSAAHPGPGSFSARFGLGMVAPTGAYSRSAAVNLGGGAWQVSPYLAVTWRTSRRWEVSARAIYDWSGWSVAQEASGGQSLRLQAGDQFALNASASYGLRPNFRAGVGGYLLQQVSEATTGGARIPDSLQSVYALGPVTRWQVGRTTLLFAGFREFGARNRPQGVSFNFRLQQPL